MQSDTQVQIDPDQSIGQQIDRIDRTIQNQQFLVQSLIKSFLKNSSLISQDDSLKKELSQINQRYEDINEQIILDTSTFSAYDTAFSQIQNRLNKIENQLNKAGEKEENMEDAEKDLLIQNMKVDIECLKEQFSNISGTGENSSAKNTVSILKTAFMSKFKKMKNHLKAYQESTNKAISSLRADLENLEMSGQEYHQEFTRLNSKIQNFQITLNYLRDQMNIPDDQISSNMKSSQFSREIESINKSIESIQQKCVLREDAQDYENKVNSVKEKLAQFPLIAAQQEKCSRDILNLQGELTQLKNSQYNSSVSISADYQSKLNSIIESQQKSDETLRKTKKVVISLKSELEQLKQSNQSQNEKIVTRDIQINDSPDQSSKIGTMWNKVKANFERHNRKFKQNEAQINKISDDVNNIQERLAKMSENERLHSHDSNSNNDNSALLSEIKKLKKEVNSIKDTNDNNDENQFNHDTDSITQRINQIIGQQTLIVEQYNGLHTQFDRIKNELNDLNAKIEDNEEKKNLDIELINQRMKSLSENLNEDTNTPVIQQRSVPLVLDNADGPDGNDESSSELSKRVKIIESNLNALRTRTESVISNQNRLVTQFNELVPQLRQMKDQLIDHILQNQHSSPNNKNSLIEVTVDYNDESSNNDNGNSDDLHSEIKSLKSAVSSLRSKVNQIEKGLGSGEEFHPFLNQVRTEVNSLEKEIATIKSNSSDVSTSAFKNQSNQISKLQRQVHTLKRNFEKHLILSSNTGAPQEGIDDEESEKIVDGNNFEVSVSDDNLSERVANLENLTKNLVHSNDALTKDNKNIHSTLKRISNSLDDMNNSVGKVNLSSPTKRSINSPKGDFENENIEKKLSQLYVQVNSYYSGMSSLSNSFKDLSKEFDQLRNDVNSTLMKSPNPKKNKVNKSSKFEKSNHNLSDMDYNDNENSENF